MNLELKRKLFKAQEEERTHKEALDKAYAETEAVKDEIRNHPEIALTITDHALMQYLRRALKEDMKKHIKDLLNLCDRAGEPDEQNRGGDTQYVYNNDGPNNTTLTMIIKENSMVTCYVNDKENTDAEEKS